MTTIARFFQFFFVTTRLVYISRPTPSTRHVSHPVRAMARRRRVRVRARRQQTSRRRRGGGRDPCTSRRRNAVAARPSHHTSRQVTPRATNANDGKQRQRHRRSCAWALTTGRARRGDSRCNSSTVMHVVNPQHSKLTTSKSGSNDNGGLLYVSETPEVPLEKSSSTRNPNDPPPPIATLRSEHRAK